MVLHYVGPDGELLHNPHNAGCVMGCVRTGDGHSQCSAVPGLQHNACSKVSYDHHIYSLLTNASM